MLTLAWLYHPITGTPFQADSSYREVAPCSALAPYIRCFWGSERPLPGCPTSGGIVIPDTCMDIIFRIDYAANCISSSFCTLDEHSSFSPPSSRTGGLSSTFAIRFYAWTARLFAEAPLRGSLNGRYPAEAFFPDLTKALPPVLLAEPTLTGRIRAAEKVLLTHLHPDAADPAVLNAIHYILRTDGRCRMAEVSADIYDACMATIRHNEADADEITAAGLTAAQAELVSAPMIEECFLNLECRFKWEREIAEGDDSVLVCLKVVSLHMDERHLDEGDLGRTGRTGLLYNIHHPIDPEHFTGTAHDYLGVLEKFRDYGEY